MMVARDVRESLLIREEILKGRGAEDARRRNCSPNKENIYYQLILVILRVSIPLLLSIFTTFCMHLIES